MYLDNDRTRTYVINLTNLSEADNHVQLVDCGHSEPIRINIKNVHIAAVRKHSGDSRLLVTVCHNYFISKKGSICHTWNRHELYYSSSLMASSSWSVLWKCTFLHICQSSGLIAYQLTATRFNWRSQFLYWPQTRFLNMRNAPFLCILLQVRSIGLYIFLSNIQRLNLSEFRRLKVVCI